ncbi:hypothetical protein Tco_0436636 [Tanacetum coccineum]
MPYPRFTKVIINHFISKDKTIFMRNWINLHTVCDDTILGTLKVVSKTEDYHKYGALSPKEMINQAIKDSKAYKTYLDFATRKATPKKARNGLDNEDANEHIEKVLEIVDLFHVPNITEDQLMLRVFLISLTGAASRWLRNEPTGSIKTWEDLKTKFLKKYCPPGRTAKKMEEINNFQQ